MSWIDQNIASAPSSGIKFLGEERNRFIYEYYQGLCDLRRKGPAAAGERLAALRGSKP